jgi:hypothetical protein
MGLDNSIPRIRAAEEGRSDASQRIENHHTARQFAQKIHDELLAVLKEAEEAER